MRRFLLLFSAVFLSLAAFAATTELATWNFTSDSYPANKTAFKATGGKCTESTFYLNGTGSTWNTNKGYAFTAVTDITLTLKTTVAIPQNTVISFAADMFYNKDKNAPAKGYTLTVSENDGVASTTGLNVESISLSTSSANKIVKYTTQADLDAGATIKLIYTQTGKAGTGEAYFGNIVISTEAELGGGGETPTGLSLSADKTEMTFGEDAPVLTLDNPGGVAVTWSSKYESVATVDQTGKVTVTGAGTTTIKVEETGNKSNFAELKLTVNPKPHGLAYEKTSYVVNGGESFTTPTLTNPNKLTVTYSSSNTDVATVDANTGDVTLTGVFGTTAITATATNSAEKHCTEGSATYTIRVKNPDANIYEDVLTYEAFGVDENSNSYADYEYRSNVTGILYFGNMMEGNSAIQMRYDVSRVASGIIIKANDCGLILKKVTVVWQSNTQSDRVLEVYGSDAPYTALSTTKAEMGTKLGEIAKETSTSYVLADADSYQYIALQSKTGALYLSSITLEWEGKVEPKFAADLTIAPDENEKDANVITLSNVNISNGLAFDFTGYNVYLNDTELGGTDVDLANLPFIPSGRLTISNGTYTYPVAVTWPDLAGITAKITNVKYWAWKDKEHLITDGKWYLDAEYTVAADTEMELAVEYEFTGNASGVGHVKTVTGNTAYVEGIGWFSVETETGADGKKYDLYKYYTDAAGDFKVTPKFPLFVKNALNDKFMAPEGTTRTVAIEGATLMVEVEKVAQQPDDTEDTGNISGVESVVVDSEGAVEYYNLQGVRVDGALTPGIYIRRTATGTGKVAIR